MQKILEDKVVLVTGASRGIGKGIAIAFGECGATVYITGRSLDTSQATVSGSLMETAQAVEAAGGTCIPVQVDHGNDDQVRSLFSRIADEQNGQLDVLVNNVYSGVQSLKDNLGTPFWECDPSLWDDCNHVGLRSHYMASHCAAKMMVPRKTGLICTISSWGSLFYIFSVPYGVGKAACDRLAADMAVELKPHNVASLSVWPGIVGTEHFQQLKTAAEQNSDAQDTSEMTQMILEQFNWETPLFTGRAIARLAADPKVMNFTGKTHIIAELAKRYGLVDENHVRPVSMRSLRFLLPVAIKALRPYQKLVADPNIPWIVLLWKILQSPKV